MSILDLRETIKTTLKTLVEDFAQVDTHGGRFDEAEVQRWAKHAPCAVVGALSVPSVSDDSGQPVLRWQWGVFIVTKDERARPRDAVALALTEACLGIITPSQRWGDDRAQPPESIQAQNLYSGTLDKTGISLWAITWTQPYDLANFDVTTLPDFRRYRSTWALSDDEDVPRAEDAVDLPPTE